MPTSDTHEVTNLLLAWSAGDSSALDRLAPLVQSELHRLARRYMRRERAGHTLQTTALINEVYLRLIDAKKISWQSRAHFYAMASRLMRHVLVDCARERHYLKRGAGALHVSFDKTLIVSAPDNLDILAVDEALTEFAKIDERKARVVEMRFFGGLKETEIAEALGVSVQTVRRDWSLARSWLLRRLTTEVDE
jgi:RNA polymerase sigma factor (TIGR02999 family)